MLLGDDAGDILRPGRAVADVVHDNGHDGVLAPHPLDHVGGDGVRRHEGEGVAGDLAQGDAGNINKRLPFDARHAPQCFADLVFAEPHVQASLNAYATRQKNRSIILAGTYGVAKSTTAHIIMRDRQRMIGSRAEHLPRLGPAELSNCLNLLDNSFNLALLFGDDPEPYVLIDEGDQMRKADQMALRHRMDTCEAYRLIITTNELTGIDEGLRSRCDVFYVAAPSSSQYLPVAERILAAEGFSMAQPLLLDLLEAVVSFRDLLRVMEELVLRMRAA
jgi:replication-associated recombination protein RarA